MKQSEALKAELAKQVAINDAMIQMNANLIAQNMNLLNVVTTSVQTVKQDMDAEKKAQLVARLAEGRKRKAEEDAKKQKELAKRMAKVRKGKNG